MTPERWKRIEELYEAVITLPADQRALFLAAASPDDPSVRAEVEALLNEPVTADGFLDPVTLSAAAAQLISDLAPDASVGRSVGPYVLDRLLGIGGMGVVYAARDRKLQRDVAIKILPRAFTNNGDRLARFEREARSLAALNHPNICGIYGLEESDGQRYLVLEFVDGDTLADVIARSARGLETREAVRIGRQIVDALEAAHEKGIIHRDLKPANIKITPGHVVKVLDFGLAKMTDDPAPLAGQSHDGQILGTTAYMSPEQARGRPIDKRSDVWAFGCILYEMLTGRLAFAGETDSDIIGKILEREPDWSALPASTTPALRRLLLRCLAKDPKQRIRDIGDVGIELDGWEQDIPASATASPTARTGGSVWLPWSLLAVVLIAALATWRWTTPAAVESDPLGDAQFSRFTDWEGTEAGAEISPDGKFVAFVADRGGQLGLWVSQIGSGNFINLTKGLAPLSLPNSLLRTIGFTGDGNEVWFTEAGDASAPKWLLPLTGGTPRAFLGQGKAAPSWSPDGGRLAYFTNGGGDPLSVADGTGADAMPLSVQTPGFFASGVHNHNPAWSPDGQWLYFSHGLRPNEEMNVWRVRPSGGVPEQLTSLHVAANLLAPLDTSTVLYVARAPNGSGPWLWSLDVNTRVSRRLTSGVEHFSSVSASRDGRRVVATVTNPTATLWQVPYRDNGPLPDDSAVVPYPSPSTRAFAPRFGGKALFYLSGDGAGDGLWRVEDGNATEVWRGVNDSLSEPAAVSPDGTRVAIVVRQQGKLRLSVMSRDGTNARTLASTITIQTSVGHGSADWSPDGNWIVVAGSDAQGPGVFKIPFDGGPPVRLTSGETVTPVWSPDGALIVYGGPVVGGQVTLAGVRPDGTPVALPDVREQLWGGHRFLPNGAGLVYLPRGLSTEFWRVDLATKKTSLLARLGDHGRIQTFDITRDGKFIVFDRLRENSDIVLIDRPARGATGPGSTAH